MVKKFSTILFNRWTRNIIFWFFVAFLHYYPRDSFFDYFWLLVIVAVLYGIPVYINNLWLIPEFLIKGRYWLYCSTFLALLFFTTLKTYYIHTWISNTFPGIHFFVSMNNLAMPYYALQNLLIFGVLAFGKFIADVLNNERKKEAFEQQRLQSELESLRAQINPHFLFNALNTIYGMARRTDNETADAVLKLSDILRSSLYNGEKNEVSIQEEINLIRQYVSFSMLRLKKTDLINLEIDADVTNQKIVPLILVSFIENAIKHGLDNRSVAPAIEIRIILSGNDLIFICVNEQLARNPAAEKNEGAIGLKNVKRRLELCYPGRHVLKIDTESERYKVELMLQL